LRDFLFGFLPLAHLSLQNVNKDYVIFVPVPLDKEDDDPSAEIPFDFLMVRTKLLYISHTVSYLYYPCLLPKSKEFKKALVESCLDPVA
jgi:hypothetical protein